MEMTTNELGNSILPCAAEVIILQFRKLMAAFAYFWTEQTENELPYHYYYFSRTNDIMKKQRIGKYNYYQCNYYPSAIIDSVWRLLIQSTRIYNEFWYELWGGYIERIDHIYKTEIFELELCNLDSFLNSQNIFLKKYDPLWYEYSEFKDKIYQDKHSIMVKKSELGKIVNTINQTVINEVILSNALKFEIWDNIHSWITNSHENIFENNERNSMFSVLTDSNKLWNYPSIFIKLLSSEFPQNLLSSFEQRYCLSNSDAILVMVEYLKFLTICKLFKADFSPSKWVDQFWHHHMSLDTKRYREFWESLFGYQVEHLEHDPSSMTHSIKLEQINKSEKFLEAYIECFGEAAPESIWPKLNTDSSEEDDFVCINIFKVLIMKIFIKINSKSTKNKEKLNSELNEFSRLRKQNKSVWKTFTNLISNFGGSIHPYSPAKDSYESRVFSGEWTDLNFDEFQTEDEDCNVPDEETKINCIAKYQSKEEYKVS